MNTTVTSIFKHSVGFITILGVSYGLILIMAIAGNLIVISTVLWHPRLKNVIGILICNLSVADLLCAIFVLPMNYLQSISKEWYYGEFLCRSTPYLQGISICTSILTLTVVAFDRYVAICHPLNRILNISKAVSIIALIWISSALLLLPWALFYKTQVHIDLINSTSFELFNETRTICIQEWPGIDKEGKNYFIYVIFITCYIAPLILISCFYFAIAFRVYKKANMTSNSRKLKEIPLLKSCGGINRSQSIRMVKMLATVVLIFAISWLPLYLIFIYYFYANKDFWTQSFADLITDYLIPIFQLISATNSCINPWIYCLYSPTYRDGFKNVIYCRKVTMYEQTRTSFTISDNLRRIKCNIIETSL